jgi:hypothetical protein
MAGLLIPRAYPTRMRAANAGQNEANQQLGLRDQPAGDYESGKTKHRATKPVAIDRAQSRFLPRFLGALLIAACFGYLAVSLTQFLLPSYANIVSRLANIPLTLGEPAAILWLLIRGAKDQPLEAVA